MTQLAEQTDSTARLADPGAPDVATRAAEACQSALDALFAKQNADGHWCAELEGDSILSSEFLLMEFALGHDESARLGEDATDRHALHERLANHLRLTQREDGTWGQYPGSPPDISATVKGYFALKLMGDSVDAPHMARARNRIHALGGAEAINTFSMFYLACLGQVSWDACPAIPPEIVLLPRWFPFHLDKCASWTRTLIVPLAICSATRPVRRLPSHRGIGELFNDQRARDTLKQRRESPEPGTWAWTFVQLDTALKLAQKAGIIFTRQQALREAVRWIEQRSHPDHSDGLGAIFPPLVYIQIAMASLGHDRSNWLRAQCEHEIGRWVVEQDDHARIQPCFSPVWDTGIALYAVTEAGGTAAGDPRVAACCDWLREREVRIAGDWLYNLRPEDRDLVMGPGGTSAAWAFEYRNEWSPDNDDTAMVAKSLRRAGDRPGETVNRDASERAVDWLLRMQNDDGGWAAFDRTTHRDWMEEVPFADHNAMQDPSCADITGRTVEALITCGVPASHDSIRCAVEYLKREQTGFGAWWGRWGVNYIYGTWQAVGGLTHAGESPRSAYLVRTMDWLRSIQQPSGAFGENANSYLDGNEGAASIGKGVGTASQTAWAAMSMMFLVGPDDPAVEAAIGWLCDTQLRNDTPAAFPVHPIDEPRGSWRESEYTGGGFPRVFYLRYHLYRHYFPLMALARYTDLTGNTTI